MHKVKKALRIAIIAISSLLSLSVITLIVVFLINNPENYSENGKSSKDINTVVIDGVKYLPKEDVLNILIIGIDEDIFEPVEGSTIRNTAVADFIAVVSVNTKEETYSVTMINRDTIASVNVLGLSSENVDTVYTQIGLAHTYGSGGVDSISNLINSVSALLYGVKIDYYIRLTMDAIPIIVDDIGGVDVTVDGDLSSINSSWIDGASIRLDSSNVLQYVRARQSVTDGTNLKRMERQTTFIEGFLNKLENSTFELSQLLSMVSDLPSSCYKSNTNVYVLRDTLSYFQDYEFSGFNNILGEARYLEFAYFYPEYSSIKAIVKEVFFDERKD